MKKSVCKFEAVTPTIHVTGIVIPVAWDRHGKPTRLAISAHGEREYVIDRRAGKGREMAKLLRAWIQAEGVINKNGTIVIKRFTIMENDNIDIAGDHVTRLIGFLLPILIPVCTVMAISCLAA